MFSGSWSRGSSVHSRYSSWNSRWRWCSGRSRQVSIASVETPFWQTLLDFALYSKYVWCNVTVTWVRIDHAILMSTWNFKWQFVSELIFVITCASGALTANLNLSKLSFEPDRCSQLLFGLPNLEQLSLIVNPDPRSNFCELLTPSRERDWDRAVDCMLPWSPRLPGTEQASPS